MHTVTSCLWFVGDGPLTVFAPNNDGFDKLPTGKFSDLLSNTTALQGKSSLLLLLVVVLALTIS